MSATLEIRDLRVRRGVTEAVRGTSFRFDGPGWFGIIGANGSGKTSLLRAVAGRLEPVAGIIAIDGVDRTEDRLWRAQHIGFAPDGSMLPDALTPRELYAVLARSSTSAMSTPLSQLHQALGIGSLHDLRIGSMSAGMRQRVAIFSAFATTQSRSIVILDEPFNWLDPIASYDTKVALSVLVAAGLTLVTAQHDLGSLALSCDAGMVMAEGEIVAELSKHDLVEARHDLPRFERTMMDRLRLSPSVAIGDEYNQQLTT